MSTARRKSRVSDETLAELTAMQKKIEEHTRRTRELRRQFVEEFDAGCIYVVEFASGMTKVGKTANASGRLQTHARHAEVHGNPVVRSWASRTHPGCSATENLLKRFCALVGTRTTGEYFTGVPFELAADYALRLARQARNGNCFDEPFDGKTEQAREQEREALGETA